jgi:uncharacterized membrane protein
VAKSGRIPAFIAYLIPLIGPIYVLLFNRKDLFALYHACQSLAIVITSVLLTLLWGALAWGTSWISLIGPIFGVSTFALVMATWGLTLVTWFMGMWNALQGRYRRLPIFGQWGEKLFLRLHTEEEVVAPQESPEAAV